MLIEHKFLMITPVCHPMWSTPVFSIYSNDDLYLQCRTHISKHNECVKFPKKNYER